MQLYFKNSGQNQTGNVVNVVVLGGYTLPEDCMISINGDKLIAESQILDGVSVYERVTRKPWQVALDFTMREKDIIQGNNSIIGGGLQTKITKGQYQTAAISQWKFPSKTLAEMVQNTWIPDMVLQVQNSLLNNVFGIFQLVIRSVKVTTIRGSINVPITLNCSEDYYSTKSQGTTLLI